MARHALASGAELSHPDQVLVNFSEALLVAVNEVLGPELEVLVDLLQRSRVAVGELGEERRHRYQRRNAR